MSPMLFSFLLLLQFKLTLFFSQLLLAASDPTFLFVLLLLQFDCLLRLGTDTGCRSLLSRFALNPLGVLRDIFYNSVHSRAEMKSCVVSENIFEQLIIFRFRTEDHSRSRYLMVLDNLENTYPKRLLKIHSQVTTYFAHDNPSFKIDEQRTDNPEGQVTYPVKQDGRATYRLWRILRYTLRFYPCMLRDNYII